MTPPGKARTLEPLRGLAKAAGACSVQVSHSSNWANAYGQCMLSQYRDMQPGACAREFEAFKACVTKQMGRKW